MKTCGLLLLAALGVAVLAGSPARAENDLEQLDFLLDDPEIRAALAQVGKIAGPAGADPCDAEGAAAPGCIANGKIEHVIFVVLENHTFDNYFGRVNRRRNAAAELVDYVRVPGADVSTEANTVPQRIDGRSYRFDTRPFRLDQYCGWSDLGHGWNDIHEQVNHGKLDGYLLASPPDAPAMGQFEEQDLQFYYAVAERFAIADRAFTSAATQSLPGHYYSISGTSRGFIDNSFETPRRGPSDPAAPDFDPIRINNEWPTIFDSLSAAGVSWTIYMPHVAVPMLFDNWKDWARAGHMMPTVRFLADLEAGTLPQVSYVSPAIAYTDEHPGLSANQQRGQLQFATLVSALLRSPLWSKSVFIITYDDSGGWYDHVPPPRTYQPNDGCTDPTRCLNGTYLPGTNHGNANPLSETARAGDNFDLFGARLPMMIISPWLKGARTNEPGYDSQKKQGYVSHHVYENSTILSLIEWRFGLEPLNIRTRAYREGWRNPGCDWDVATLEARVAAGTASAEERALAWSASLPDPFRTVRCEPCANDELCVTPDPDAGKNDRARVPDLSTPDPNDTRPMELTVAENRYLDPLLDVFDFSKTSPPDGTRIAGELDPLAGTDFVEWVQCPGPNPARVPPSQLP